MAADTSSGLELSVSYGYTDDLLTSITTPSTVYSFTHGDFAQRTAVKVGTRTLANYTYESQTNRLLRLKYTNADYVQYIYDSHGRVIKQGYEDRATVQFFYDNNGNLATTIDSEENTVTTYYYDLLNRQVGYWEKNDSVDHKVTYLYNEDNNIESMTETVNGDTKTYTYTYDDDNRVTSMTVDGITVTYTYDGFGRLTQKQTANGTQTVRTDSLTYRTVGNATTSQVSAHNGTTYTYDDNGNILTVTDSSGTVRYTYDTANQLVREDNQAHDYTKVWTYDNAGNILTRTEYTYTTAEDLTGITPTDTVNYTYGNSDWGDLLTAYDGQTIHYDNIGNPMNDGIRTYTWKHGRELASVQTQAGTWQYLYNADGLRVARVGEILYEYVYNGGQLVSMSRGLYNPDVLKFVYDASGVPLAVEYDGTTYYYCTNLQGDVVGLIDGSGTQVVAYSYDAWGKLLSCTGSKATTLGILNPLRYRSYIYDVETGLYYLQSRYYNPEWGRFINADGYTATGQGFVGNNMFAYCLNNAVILSDDTGARAVLNTRGLYSTSYKAVTRDVTREVDVVLSKVLKDVDKYKLDGGVIQNIETTVSLLGYFHGFFSEGGQWMIKEQQGWEDTIQTPFPGGKTMIRYHGHEMTPESLGNFTYGMIGHAYGFSLEILILGSIYNAENFFTDQGANSEEKEDWGEIKSGYEFMQEYKWD